MINLSKELIRQIIADGGFQTLKDIGDYLKDLYGIEISAEYVSRITDVVIEHARLWQNRPLGSVYPFVFMDAIHYKVKEDSKIKNRGVKDVLIFIVDALLGFKEAISASYPESVIQRCINEAEGLSALDIVEEKWVKKYPTAIRIWRDNWDVISPFFSFPQEIRTIMYTTNIIEGVNRQFRKVTKTKSTFPSDESLLKMLYLASQNIMKKWTMRYRDWDSIYNQLSIYFDNRI